MLAAAAVVVCALDLLGRSHAIAPIQLLPTPPIGQSTNAEAFVRRDPPTIYLITSTEAFRDAQSNSSRDRLNACRKIASIIVHEEWHLRHGADEEGAYSAQLIALMAMGAQPVQISEVRRSMAAVLKTTSR
jgi:hypothetical protein